MSVYNNFDEKLLSGIIGVSYIGNPKDNTIMYLTKKIEGKIGGLANTKNALVFLENGVVVPEAIVDKNEYVFCDDPPSLYTRVVMKMAETRDADLRAKKYTLIPEGYYIGEDVVLGKNVYIEPGALIDHNVKIGDNVVIRAGAKIRFDTVIGDNCVIGENTVIGEPGFNVAEVDDGRTVIMPNFGRVVIGNDVSIGANTSVSRGTADNTIISDYVKIDSNVRIGHDVNLNRYVEIRANACVAGYSCIGERTVVCVGACIKNRMTVGKDCVVGMGAVLTNNVRDGITVKGDPAISLEKLGQHKVFEMELKELLRKNGKED